MLSPTKTDATAEEWTINDDVVRLREWGSDTIHLLPDDRDEIIIGAAETCAMQLADPARQISRQHARLAREQARWVIRDLESKNGLRLDGARRHELVLDPGVEIGIGGLTLVAESTRLIALRALAARLLGWGSDRIAAVDHALRSIRMAASRRVPLVLCGDGDLVSTAQTIHRHSLGASRPFVVCDPRRRRGEATVRSAENFETAAQAMAAAVGGSLCVRSERLPRDIDHVLRALRDPGSRVELVVCARRPEDARTFVAVPIIVPPLARRRAEIDRIIQEYALDALDALGLPLTGFTPIDREWVREHAARSLPEIEKATLRLAAIRDSNSINRAATRLGMTHVSLSRWIGRRRLPMRVEP